MIKKQYPSDISREQFESIREILELSKNRTRPRKVDLYCVFNAILYLLKSGCQWRMLPSEYPNWKTCHYYFTGWRLKTEKNRDSALDRSLKKIGWRGPTKTGAEIGVELFNH